MWYRQPPTTNRFYGTYLHLHPITWRRRRRRRRSPIIIATATQPIGRFDTTRRIVRRICGIVLSCDWIIPIPMRRKRLISTLPPCTCCGRYYGKATQNGSSYIVLWRNGKKCRDGPAQFVYDLGSPTLPKWVIQRSYILDFVRYCNTFQHHLLLLLPPPPPPMSIQHRVIRKWSVRY